MEDVYENENRSPDADGQPGKHFNGSSGKSVSLRILSMPSSPLPPSPAAGLRPSSPSAVSLSSAPHARDTRHRLAKDRMVRKTPKVSTIGAGVVALPGSFPTVATIGEGANECPTSPTENNALALCGNTAVKKSKVDFVRFDSTEIHYTENEEVRKKISDEIKSIGAFALGEIHEVKQITAHKYKIEKVTDSSLRQALKSISHTNVKELDLSGNLLSVINAHDFAPLTNLEQLNLSSNVFSGSVDLQPLQKVRTIDLNNNFITDVLVGASVENLYAVNNNISRVDCQEAGESSNPKRFFLANNKLSSLLDLSAACRVRVETLDAKLNEIDTLNFGDLVGSSDTLRHLSLEDNFIFDVSNYPKVEFSRLDTLDLSSNKLAQMSVAFRAVAAAKSINLANNKFVLIGNITFSTSVTKFDLSGNGFQCETLKKFFEKNKHLQSYTMVSTRETCTGTTRHQGPYCCEDLSAPYADRLISLKQKEQSLYYGRGSEQNRVECERENQARQAKMKSIRNKYHVTVNEATYRERKKIMLNQEKAALEQKLPLVSGRVGEIESLVRESAEQLNLTTEGQNPLQLMRSIVQTFEDLHADEQTIQDQAIKDWEMHNQKDAPLSEENARLKKAVQGLDETLQSSNSTLLELSAKEQRLLKILKMDGQ